MYNKWIFAYQISEDLPQLVAMWPRDTPTHLIQETIRKYHSIAYIELRTGDWQGFGTLPIYTMTDMLAL